MKTVIFVNAFIAFVFAPFLSLFMVSQEFDVLSENMIVPTNELKEPVNHLRDQSTQVGQSISNLGILVTKQGAIFERT